MLSSFPKDQSRQVGLAAEPGLALSVTQMHAKGWNVDYVECQLQAEFFGFGRIAYGVVAGLVANTDFDLDGVRVEWSSFAGEFADGVEGDEDVEGSAPDRQLHVHAVEPKRFGRRKDGILDDETRWSRHADLG